jgi:hypothetical protein
VSNPQQFVARLNDWADENLRRKPVEFQKRVCAEAIRQLVLNTPVGNEEGWAMNAGRRARGLPILRRRGYLGGHMRRNWQAAFNVPARGELPGVDPNGTKVVQELMATVGQLMQPSLVWFSCPVPYGQVIEFGGPGKKPWSRQAPNGVVGPTLAALRQIFGGLR